MKHFFSSLACAIALIGLTSAHSQGAVVYREIFSNTTGTTGNLTAGWQAYIGSAAAAAGTVSTPGVFLDNRSGNPINVDNSANNDPVGNANGMQFGFVTSNVGSASDRNIFLAFTTEFSLNLSGQSAASVSWYQGTPTGIVQRAAIQVGGNWYANDAGFSGLNSVTSGNNMNQSNQQTLNLLTTAWRSLTVNPGTSLALGSVTTIPGFSTATITGFGVLTSNITLTSTNARFDTFTVEATAVPEPGVISLLLLGVLAALRFVRRCRA